MAEYVDKEAVLKAINDLEPGIASLRSVRKELIETIRALPTPVGEEERLRAALVDAGQTLDRVVEGLDAASEAGVIAAGTYDYVVRARDRTRAALEKG